MDCIKYKHSFNSGDLISILPGVRSQFKRSGKKAIIYQRLGLPADYGHSNFHPIRNDKDEAVCMNEGVFKMMKPLLESQEYIESFEMWNGQEVDVDFDKTRFDARIPLPNGSIHHWPTLIFPQLECDLSEKWLSADRIFTDMKGNIIINRTERYQNPYIDYYFLKPYQDRIIFAGLQRELDIFCNTWGLNVPLLIVEDFLGLATAIASCKFFIGNQSLNWHISDAMKVPRILEVCQQYPNTFPTGANGYSFIAQEALEHQFKKLLNE